MTNQEVNQLFWELPIHWRNAIESLLERDYLAAIASARDLMQDGATLLFKDKRINDQEAQDWVDWRMSIIRQKRRRTPFKSQ